jgi:hypothetical protein
VFSKANLFSIPQLPSNSSSIRKGLGKIAKFELSHKAVSDLAPRQNVHTHRQLARHAPSFQDAF